MLLSTEHLKMLGADKRTPKFTFKYIGPFKMKRVVNDNAYELDLPPQLQIHPVLNISRLKPYRDGHAAFPARPAADSRPPPEVALEDGAPVFEVESIIAKRGAGARTRYLVKWRGYPSLGIHLGAALLSLQRPRRHRRLRAKSWRTKPHPKGGRM